MHYFLPLCLLIFVVLQQINHIESLISPIQSADNEAGRPNVARRLRAPLMGRSLLSASSSNDDDVDFIHHEVDNNSLNDDELIELKKRRYGVPLFGRRWISKKRRGPLFG